MNIDTINPAMIVLAREARGMGQLELAKGLGISQATLSKIEAGEVKITAENLDRLLDVIHYPLSFFTRQNEIVPYNLSYRKRQKVPQKLLTTIEARANVSKLQVEQLGIFTDLPTLGFEPYIITEKNTPIDLAVQLRKNWKLGDEGVPDMTKLLESKGILINEFDFNTERVDALTILTQQKQPIINVNAALLGDRQRFTLAYELGHLLMHTYNPPLFNQDVSHEANVFAASFLLPEKAIRKDFEQEKLLSISLLAQLKTKWKVSMIALLYRADDLGYLTPNQKRYLLQQFNTLRIRRREPVELDVKKEQPALLKNLIATVKTKLNLNVIEMAGLMGVESGEYLDNVLMC